MTKPDILVTAPIPEKSLEAAEDSLTLHRLWRMSESEQDHVGPAIRGIATIAHYGRIDSTVLDRFPNVEIISSFGVRYDNSVDVAEAGRRGIVITNTPDLMTDEVADFIVGLLIATLRRFSHAERFVREGRWSEGAYPLTSSLRGRRVGIAGLGKIGKAVATRLEAFGVPIAYTGRRRQADVSYPYFEDIVDLARSSDVLILSLPADPSTRHIVNADVLSALGPDGVLINAARGSLVDEVALAAALLSGRILAAGLDVFENEPRIPADLASCDRALLLPHIASASHGTRLAMGDLVMRNLQSWFGGHGALTPVAESRQHPDRPETGASPAHRSGG